MISRSASYAVRALAYMASVDGDGWMLNREIAHELSIPSQFLTKILSLLAGEGLLLSQRGKSGGFRLVRPPHEITLLSIVDPFDRLSRKNACILGQPVCSDETACPLHGEGSQLSGKLVEILADHTLADLARSPAASGFPRAVVPASPPGKRTRAQKVPAASARRPIRKTPGRSRRS